MQETPEVTSPTGGRNDQWWIKPPPNTNRSLPTAAYLKDLRVHRLVYFFVSSTIFFSLLRIKNVPEE